jgi:hypothetical protein
MITLLPLHSSNTCTLKKKHTGHKLSTQFSPKFPTLSQELASVCGECYDISMSCDDDEGGGFPSMGGMLLEPDDWKQHRESLLDRSQIPRKVWRKTIHLNPQDAFLPQYRTVCFPGLMTIWKHPITLQWSLRWYKIMASKLAKYGFIIISTALIWCHANTDNRL